MKTNTNGSGITLADLVINARNAAQKAFTEPSQLAAQLTKLDEFKASGLDALDFSTWENAFNAEMEMLKAFSKQPSPATAAAAKTQTPAAPAQS
jgi:hypothetical protein